MKDVPGTGKSGRILKEDIYRFLDQATQPAPSLPISSPPLASRPAPEILLEDTRKPIQGFMKTMVKTMTISNQIPQFGLCDEVWMNELVRLREQLNETMSERGIRFTYMPFFIKVMPLYLRKHCICSIFIPYCA